MNPQTGEKWLPLYEAKMIHHYDHRWATYTPSGDTRLVTDEEKQDPNFVVMPRYWVPEHEVHARLGDHWPHNWLLGWRDICRSTDERTAIACVIGEGASPEGGFLLAFPQSAWDAAPLLANWNSLVFDFVARQKVGGTHLKYFTMRQLPMVSAETLDGEIPWSHRDSLRGWIVRRVAELTYTTAELAPFAAETKACRQPYSWHRERRYVLRCELDAAYFHLYGIERQHVNHIMDAFPILRRREQAAHGEYRTRRVILAMYDDMARACHGGEPYSTKLDPPPADPS